MISKDKKTKHAKPSWSVAIIYHDNLLILMELMTKQKALQVNL